MRARDSVWLGKVQLMLRSSRIRRPDIGVLQLALGLQSLDLRAGRSDTRLEMSTATANEGAPDQVITKGCFYAVPG